MTPDSQGFPLKRGPRPYGELPSEAATLKRILAERQEGRALAGIAQRLNADGIPARRGGQWKAGTIAYLLKR